MIKLPQNNKNNSDLMKNKLGKRRPIDVYSTEVGVSEVVRSSVLGAVAVMAGLVMPVFDKIHLSDSTDNETEQRKAEKSYMQAVQKVGKSRFNFRNDEFERKAQIAETQLAEVVISLEDS